MTTGCTMLRAEWQKMESWGQVPSPRHGYRAVAKDDMLIIYGGGNGRVVYRDLFVLQTSSGQWRQVPLFTLPERAGFGLAIINYNLYLFGGMSYNKRFLNDLYYLSLQTWKWDLLLPKLAPGTPPPCARVGHSFTRINDQLILLFAGVTEPAGYWVYLNDLYALILDADEPIMWRLISANGIQPPARESHSACLYKPDSGGEKLIIYGGMCGYRLDDVWGLDISTYTWCQYQIPMGANSPPPRSMHGAAIAGSRMFVFGGWAPADKHKDNDVFISPQNLCCFNLVDKKWEKLNEKTSSGIFPHPRTGHNLVVVQEKIFMWSGRTGSNYHDDVSVQNDLWCLQVTPQKVSNRLILSNKSETMIKVEWDPVPLATHYLLQIQEMPMAPINDPQVSTASSCTSMNQNPASTVSMPTTNHPQSHLKPTPKASTRVSITTTINPQPSIALSTTSTNQIITNQIITNQVITNQIITNQNPTPGVTSRVPIATASNPKPSIMSRNQNPVLRVSTPIPGIPTPVISTPIVPQKSALETFLTPKPIVSGTSSVKLMRSSSGRPVAVVPKSLIPNRTISCGSTPSNIVIVSRKRSY